MPARFKSPEAPRVGHVRGFPNTYEMNAYTGYVSSNVPAARWYRGELTRATQPAFVGPAWLGSQQFDPTDPAGWVTQRG